MAYCVKIIMLIAVSFSLLDDASCWYFRPPCGLMKPFNNLDSTEDGIQYIGDYVVVCFNDSCRGITYERLCTLMPGLFVTMEEYANATGLPYRTPGQICSGDPELRRKRHVCPGVDDGDMCCSTIKYFTSPPTYVMSNAYGEPCYIVAGQFMITGSCGTVGLCQGKCQMENSTQWFLALNLATGILEFTPFYISTYCSCQNTSG